MLPLQWGADLGRRMNLWGPWDWIAYLSLGASVILLAIDIAVASSENLKMVFPAFIRRPAWRMLIVISFFLGTAILVFQQLGFVPPPKASVSPHMEIENHTDSPAVKGNSGCPSATIKDVVISGFNKGIVIDGCVNETIDGVRIETKKNGNTAIEHKR